MAFDPVNARKSNHKDRLCDLCHQPMIGIMRESFEETPRRICIHCGGIQCTYIDDPKAID